MCCLLVKPEGAKLPSYSTLKACFRANPDGCGYVSTKSNYKSMDFEDFYYHLQRVGRDEKCILHFRWATHGSVNVKNCHPFKDGHIWFAHNGVLPIESTNDKTDSEIAFRSIIMPKIRKHGFDSKEMIDACLDIVGSSRFAIFDVKQNAIRTIGSFTPYEGVYFSNMRWLAYKNYANIV